MKPERAKAIVTAKRHAVSAKVHLDQLEEEYMSLKGLSSEEHIEWARKFGAAERDLLGRRDEIRNLYRTKGHDDE